MALALQRPRRGAAAADIKNVGREDAGSSIAFCLRTKGFCLIGDSCDDVLLTQALAEVDSLDEAGQLEQPNSLIQDGLLGSQGSAKIAEMPLLSESEPEDDSQALNKLDFMMWTLLQRFVEYQADCGLACTSRSAAVVHQTGDTCFGEVDLSDEDADKWHTLLIRQKVIALVFLGPSMGTLELAPYDDDAIPIEINTYAGLTVLLRTDQLTFSYNSRDTAAVLSCFFMQDNILMMPAAVREAHMTPAAVAMEEFVAERLKELKMEETEGTVYDSDVPRNFVLCMNHQYHTTAMTAVPAIGVKFPTTWNYETFFRGVHVTGCDLITAVPISRWEHDVVYDASENCWQMNPPKTNCRHASWIEGAELFDAKMFGLSPAECKGMDPNQRLVLETSYEALLTGGVSKKKMLGSTCGVYVGTASGDWTMAERTQDVGTFGATGGAASITAGRLSFCLGLKGACLSIDTEAAAGMTATLLASESIQDKGRGRVQEFALGIATGLSLAKNWWPLWSAAGYLCPEGRCFTFDENARGYVRSEGAGSIMVRMHTQKIDGEEVEATEYDDPVGLLAAGWSNHSGRTASLTAPSAPSIEEVFAETVRQARIQAYDVDAVEIFGSGTILGDAVESSIARKALRYNNFDETLIISGSKTQTGNGVEMSAMYQIAKALWATRVGLSPPNLHLRKLNPHLDFEESAIAVADERLKYRMASNYQCVLARGFGGTNVNIMTFGCIDENLHPPPKVAEEFRPKLVYWPQGGGVVDFESLPRHGYFISGTWNEWATDQRMEEEGDGVYGFTVTLGEQRWEQFHIMLDGDSSKLLYPTRYKAPKGTPVLGPDDLGDTTREYTWFINGRAQYEETYEGSNEAIVKQEPFADPTNDKALPGTQFRVRLHVAGKWQTVSWSKCGFRELESYGTYHMLTSAGDWSISNAVQFEDHGDGMFRTTVDQDRHGLQFLIVRNRDLSQAIYPSQTTTFAERTKVIGPDDLMSDTHWLLSTSQFNTGDRVTIELEVSKDKSPVVRWRSSQ